MARSKILAEQSAQRASAAANPRLGEKAYQAILQGLFDHKIPAGAKLSQGWLIETLGLTAQPLREALRKLEMEGLVKIYPRSSISFVKADTDLAVSTYQFRTLIERAGARALAEGAKSSQIQDVADQHRALLKHLETNDFGPTEEAELTRLEEYLHGTLVSASEPAHRDNGTPPAQIFSPRPAGEPRHETAGGYNYRGAPRNPRRGSSPRSRRSGSGSRGSFSEGSATDSRHKLMTAGAMHGHLRSQTLRNA